MGERIPYTDIEPMFSKGIPVDKHLPKVLVVDDSPYGLSRNIVEALRKMKFPARGIFVNPNWVYESDQQSRDQYRDTFTHIVDLANMSNVLVTDYGPGQIDMRDVFYKLKKNIGVIVISNAIIEEDEFKEFPNVKTLLTPEAGRNNYELLRQAIRTCPPLKD